MSDPVTFKPVVVDDAGVLRYPLTFFEANAEAIHAAIEALIIIPDTFDAATALHKGTTAGKLAATTTIQQAMDVLDGLPTYTFNPATEGHGGTTASRLAGITTVAGMATAFDALVVTVGKEYCLPFSYMQLSKCYTTGSLGWITQEVSGADYYFSAGGYESGLATLQNGTAYIELVLPPGATEFATTAAIELYLIGSSLLNTEAKYDMTIYVTKAGVTGKTNVYTAAGQVVGSTTVPTLISLNKANLITDLTTAGLTTGSRRIVIELEFYSKSSKSIKLLQGAVNLIG